MARTETPGYCAVGSEAAEAGLKRVFSGRRNHLERPGERSTSAGRFPMTDVEEGVEVCSSPPIDCEGREGVPMPGGAEGEGLTLGAIVW